MKLVTSGFPVTISVKREPTREVVFNIPMIFITSNEPNDLVTSLSSRFHMVEVKEKINFEQQHINYNEYINL